MSRFVPIYRLSVSSTNDIPALTTVSRLQQLYTADATRGQYSGVIYTSWAITLYQDPALTDVAKLLSAMLDCWYGLPYYKVVVTE